MNCPTKMHELFGVETGEVFGFKEEAWEEVKYYCLDACGNLFLAVDDHKRMPSPKEIVAMINRPDCIIRKPRPTQKQLEMLMAMPKLHLYWLVKTKAGQILSYQEKPTKTETGWTVKEKPYTRNTKWFQQQMHIHQDDVLDSLVSWDDKEPLDIEKVINEYTSCMYF